ncbi:hypothetical protein PDN14_27005 [Bacillus cereus group sp. Bc222]|uniref:Uncharacterized protein n=1 Tax=Bacillus mobilis TaxID=2026190 RepID=A0ABV4S216_9BACI|nr:MULTISPECIES: hypothetical protein [Bacillus]ANT40224.1 hypothetical protein [Bacillus phage PfNC7401]ANT40293.1 hypothetical protein [Bacillus phage PfIS075]EEK97180.1 hypothetical protein bcere0013_56680 [Bacillus cereus BDRD-ST26]MCU5074805.1 hypothetical protein [Bacillus paranthracis]MDA1598256.1 hypothetical protein [Bacillus cereus group sp. TH217LC]
MDMEIKIGIDKEAWGIMLGYYAPERTLGIHFLCFYLKASF